MTPHPPTPISWRIALWVGVLALGAIACVSGDVIGTRGQAMLGIVCFLGLTASLSGNLRAVDWRTIGWGMLIQLLLALFILRVDLGREIFDAMGSGINKFLDFSNQGAKFVFGPLADGDVVRGTFKGGFILAFQALPTIVFVSSFFTLMYYLGVLQMIVKVFAVVMAKLMRTSGAETLSASANVFMGMTEAPLIVRPYIARMTQSELLALMSGGMATVSGGIMGVYAANGADPVAMLATGVMAAPCGLYLSKLVLPETEEPLTRGQVKLAVEQPYGNAIDAVAGGASEGLKLALNVAAMLIAFVAFVAMIDALLGLIHDGLTLGGIFSVLFRPVAVLIGIEEDDVPYVADLLGQKLAINELYAFGTMRGMMSEGQLSERSVMLGTYALTSFANIGSIGIELGGIGAMAPERRGDLARLGLRALFVGFTATLINAALAGILEG